MLEQKNPIAESDSSPKKIRESYFSSPVLTELRIATKSRHSILDASMPLANPDAVWDHYIDHLQMLATWLLPIEKWLSHFNDGPQGAAAPPVISYTSAILADLGETFKPSDDLWQNGLPWAGTEESAYRWGVCYVIEGSQLGGEFLYKRLSTRLAPHKLSYLQCKQVGRWPLFLQAMATDVTNQGQINRACEGARDAFDALLLQLSARENMS